MKTYEDHRGLPICHITDDNRILLDDETAEAYAAGYPMVRLQVPGFDSELKLWKITGQAGAILPPKGSKEREDYRASCRKAINQVTV